VSEDVVGALHAVLRGLDQLGDIHTDGAVAGVVRTEDVLAGRIRPTPPGTVLPTADLLYAAPERCRPMGLAVDVRSDLYSVGVVLHEIVAGSPPFTGANSAALIHAHLTRTPPQIEGAPPALAAMVDRLLAKDRDDRYQSVEGLVADLALVIHALESGDDRVTFELGRFDTGSPLRAPTQLHGVAAPRQLITGVIAAVRAGAVSQAVAVRGVPGSGKSALVHSLRDDVQETGGLFVWGKADVETIRTPYGPVISALGRVIDWVLGLPAKDFADVKARLVDASGPLGPILVDLIPASRHLLDGSGPLPLAATPAMVHAAIGRLVGAVTSLARPLVLFVDDAQWADPASMDLLHSLLADGSPGSLVVVVAARENAPHLGDTPDPSAQLQEWVATVSPEAPVASIRLGLLRPDAVDLLVADILGEPEEIPDGLASFLAQQASGNPLTIWQQMEVMAETTTLRPDPDAPGRWLWSGPPEADTTPNVIAMLTTRIAAYDAATREMLAVAALAGSTFDPDVVAAAAGTSREQTRALLTAPRRDGLLVDVVGGMRFSHDWIRDAARVALPEARRAAIHRRLAQALRSSTDYDESRIYEVVAQVREAERIDADLEPELAILDSELQLRAARRARNSAAYVSAADFAGAALARLPEQSWELDAGLSFEVLVEHAVTAGLTGRPDEAFADMDLAETHDLTELQRWRVRTERVNVATLHARLDIALGLVLETLGSFGVRCSIPPTREELDTALQAAIDAAETKGWDSLGDTVCDELTSARINLLATALPVSYFASPDLHSLIGSVMVLECVRTGAAPASASGLAAMAAELVDRGGADVEQARKRGAAGIELSKRSGGELFVRYLVARFVTAKTDGIAEAMPAMRHVSALGARLADVPIRHFAKMDMTFMALLSGGSLAQVRAAATEHMEHWAEARGPLLEWTADLGLAMCRTLSGETDPDDPFAELAARDADWLPPNYHACLALMTAMAAVTADRMDVAAAALEGAENYRPFTKLEYVWADLLMLDALALAWRAGTADAAERTALVEAVRDRARELGGLRELCPHGNARRHELVLAELARLDGDHPAAWEHYDAALELADREGALWYQGWTLRLIGHWQAERGRLHGARVFFDTAAATLARWRGAPLEVPDSREDSGVLAAMLRSASSSLSLPEVTAGSASVLLSHLGADRVLIALGGYADDLTISADCEVVAGDVVVRRSGDDVTVPWANLRQAARMRETVHETGGQSSWTVPLIRGERLVGVVHIVHRTFPDLGSEGFSLVMEQAAIAIDNARLVQDLAQTEDRYRRLFAEAPLGVAAVSAVDGVVLQANSALARLVGEDVGDVVGAKLSTYVHPADQHELDILLAAKESPRELRLLRAVGTVARVVAHSAPAELDATPIVILQVEDVTELRDAEDALRHQAEFDSLTGLLNRSGLEKAIDAAVDRAGSGTELALILCGLDRFRVLNESLGHAAGDTVLSTLARRLAGAAEPDDVVARLDSDVFAVLADVPGAGAAEARAWELKRRLFTEAVTLTTGEDETSDTFVTGSVGYAMSAGPDTHRDLLRHADAALQQAKAKGRGTVGRFQDTMRRSTKERLALEQALFRALERGELFLRWQPELSLVTGRATTCEALLGWRRADGTVLAAGAFIDSAEELGLVSRFGEWVMAEAVAQLGRWDSQSIEVRAGVNVSARQLREPGFARTMQQRLGSVDPSRLVLEVTETVVAVDAEENIRVLHELRDSGMRIAIDDFGTGYSSLSYLQQLPVDILKIDRSFVTPLGGGDAAAEALVATTVTLAHTLGLEVVAEGVETEAQRDVLAALQCDTVQGYLYAKPAPEGEITPLLAGLS